MRKISFSNLKISSQRRRRWRGPGFAIVIRGGGPKAADKGGQGIVARNLAKAGQQTGRRGLFVFE